MPPHHHRHPPHHHRGLQITEQGAAKAREVLSKFFENRTASALVDQGTDGPPEPVSQFMEGVAISEVLSELIQSKAPSDLRALADGMIDKASDVHDGLCIPSNASTSLKTFFPRDAEKIEFALADGPPEMRAVAIVQTLNLRLATELSKLAQPSRERS